MAGTGFQGLTVAKLDEIDREIVRYLQEDGRLSVTAIAQAIGLSHASTRQRVQRLFESRIVHIGAFTNPGTHGYELSALITVRTDERIRSVAAALSDIPEIYYVVICSGSVDVLAEVICRDEAHLLEIVCMVRAIEGVVGSESHTFLDLVKWNYGPDFIDEDSDGAEPPRNRRRTRDAATVPGRAQKKAATSTGTKPAAKRSRA